VTEVNRSNALNSDAGTSTYKLMQATLGVAVPLWAELIKQQRGGPDETDCERIKEFGDLIVGPGGEDLLFRSKVPGQTATLFNKLAFAIAVLSFQPGGITTFGLHFESQRSNCTNASKDPS
jgi:hypothetical protein